MPATTFVCYFYYFNKPETFIWSNRPIHAVQGPWSLIFVNFLPLGLCTMYCHFRSQSVAIEISLSIDNNNLESFRCFMVKYSKKIVLCITLNLHTLKFNLHYFKIIHNKISITIFYRDFSVHTYHLLLPIKLNKNWVLYDFLLASSRQSVKICCECS
jgi:hypothetical protein